MGFWRYFSKGDIPKYDKIKRDLLGSGEVADWRRGQLGIESIEEAEGDGLSLIVFQVQTGFRCDEYGNVVLDYSHARDDERNILEIFAKRLGIKLTDRMALT
ncbi:MAG: hypothetical protein QF381_02950 [Nitrososphaerales archaeon]|jgi:hypothetical protein|nr:hypothetical protein [Nitrososphaerales archaeon]